MLDNLGNGSFQGLLISSLRNSLAYLLGNTKRFELKGKEFSLTGSLLGGHFLALRAHPGLIRTLYGAPSGLIKLTAAGACFRLLFSNSPSYLGKIG